MTLYQNLVQILFSSKPFYQKKKFKTFHIRHKGDRRLFIYIVSEGFQRENLKLVEICEDICSFVKIIMINKMCKNHEPLLVTAIFSAVSISQWKNPIWVFADGKPTSRFYKQPQQQIH